MRVLAVLRLFSSRFVTFLCAAIFLGPSVCQSAVEPLGQWHFCHPKPTGNSIHALTFANGLFVAAGDAGTIITSADGSNWTKQSTPVPVTISLISIAYGNG